MNLQILEAASDDLLEGFDLYEQEDRVSDIIFFPASTRTSSH